MKASQMEDTTTVTNKVFTFEIVRHGARAAYWEHDHNKFKVPLKMLTPMGMRQRYLLGKYNNYMDIGTL